MFVLGSRRESHGSRETRRKGGRSRGGEGCRWRLKKWRGNSRVFHHTARPLGAGGAVDGEVGSRGGGGVGGGDCKAEMGGLLISTMQYHAAGGSKARFGGNENGLSRRLMAHKDRAFRWDGRLNLDGGD